MATTAVCTAHADDVIDDGLLKVMVYTNYYNELCNPGTLNLEANLVMNSVFQHVPQSKRETMAAEIKSQIKNLGTASFCTSLELILDHSKIQAFNETAKRVFAASSDKPLLEQPAGK